MSNPPTTLPDPPRIVTRPNSTLVGKLRNYALSVVSSAWFHAYVLTLGFGLALYVADIVSDVVNAVLFIRDDDVKWGRLTAGNF